MLIVCLAIPLAGALLFKTRAPLLTEYHFQLLGRALSTKNWRSARSHIHQLFANDPQRAKEALHRCLDWPAESRTWLAQHLIESAEKMISAELMAGEWNDPDPQPGDWYILKVLQKNRQMAYTSPIFLEKD